MALYTKKLIMTAFAEMLEELPFDKITVAALVKRAGVSPNTFYYHYEDIYALLDAWFRQVVEFYAPADSFLEWKSATKAVLHRCKDHPKVVYHIFDGLVPDRLERYIFSLTDDVFTAWLGRRPGDRSCPRSGCAAWRPFAAMLTSGL